MPTDPRFLAESGPEVFTGNEMLVKGALEVEGGVHLMSGYPGSPVANFFDVLGDIKDVLIKNGVRAFQANNEALGAAAVNGSQMAACRGIAVMKSVGVHVASDALALGNLAGAHPQGGAVIIMGDDPWCDSTQVPADSRFLCEHLRMAVVEPGTPQELKDWIDLSFKLSRTWQHELEIPDRHARTIAAARELGMNRIIPRSTAAEASTFGGGGSASPTGSSASAPPMGSTPDPAAVSPVGFIVTGMAGPYLEHVLADLGLSGQFPVLQMGMSYPVDVQIVAEFSALCRDMIVIEERRSFLEKNIRDGLYHA